jgi:hypothetical protein
MTISETQRITLRLPFCSYEQARAALDGHRQSGFADGYRVSLIVRDDIEVSSVLSDAIWRYLPEGNIFVKYGPDQEWKSVTHDDDALNWANVPDPASVPEAKFSTWIVADSSVRILARAEDELHHIADLVFVNGSWLFYRVGRNGSTLGDGILLDVDPVTEQHLRDMEIESRRTARNETVLAAHLAAIEVQRMAYCIESRDLASIAAFIKARRYWPLFYSSEK